MMDAPFDWLAEARRESFWSPPAAVREDPACTDTPRATDKRQPLTVRRRRHFHIPHAGGQREGPEDGIRDQRTSKMAPRSRRRTERAFQSSDSLCGLRIHLLFLQSVLLTEVASRLYSM